MLHADHLVTVQALPGQVFHVIFKTEEIRKQFWPSMSTSSKFNATSYASNMRIVTVLHVTHEVDDNVVRLVSVKSLEAVFSCTASSLSSTELGRRLDILPETTKLLLRAQHVASQYTDTQHASATIQRSG